MNNKQKEIYNWILHQVSAGELKVGDKLATEMALGKQFKTSRMNAHLAVKALEQAGIVSRNKRQGTIIQQAVTDLDLTVLKNESSGRVMVLASPVEKRKNIHWNESTLYEFESLLQEKGYQVRFDELPESSAEFCDMVRTLTTLDYCAVVIVPDHGEIATVIDNVEQLAQLKAEIIMLNRGNCSLSAFPFHSVGFDPYEQGMAAGMFLAENNLKPFSYVSYENVDSGETYWSRKRYDGLCFVLRKQGIKIENSTDIDELIDKVRQSSDIPCLVAANDNIAMTVIKQSQAQNLTAGKDFRIIGFDNLLACRKYNLTTVGNALDKIAPALVELITKRPPWVEHSIATKQVIKSVIIKRETC